MRLFLIAIGALALLSARAQEDPVMRYDQEFFAAKNARTALDMVTLLPGFVLSLGDTNVRGYSAAAGNVLIDGNRPSDKQFALDTLLARIPVDQVERIEVIRGGRPDIDMLGQTVVANVVRQESAADSAALTLSDALYEDGRNAPGVTLETTRHFEGGRQFSGALSVSRYVELAEGNGLQTRRDANGALLDSSAVASRAGGLTGYGYGRYEMPALGGRLTVNGSLIRTDYSFHETDTAPTIELHDFMGGPLGGQSKGELGANLKTALGGDLTSESLMVTSLQGQSYSSRSTRDGIGQFFSERDHRGESLARTSLHYQLLPDLAAEATAEGAYNWLETSNAFYYGPSAITLPNARATVTEKRGQTSLHLIWSAAASLQLEVSEQIEGAEIASKADSRQSRFLFNAKPRFALTYTPAPADQLRLRIEREVGQLDFSDFVAASSLVTGAIRSGNVSILPQRDWAFELAYDRHFGSDSDVSLTVRRLALADIRDRVPVSPPGNSAATYDAPGNIGAGSEMAAIASVTLGLDRLGIEHGQLKMGATRQIGRVSDPTTGAKRSISELDPLEYSISFRQDLPDWGAAWGGSFATPCFTSATVKGCSKADYRFDEIDRFHAAPALNLFVERQFEGIGLLHFEADNLLEQRYSQTDSFYAGPRNITSLSVRQERDLASSRSFQLSLRRDF